MERLSVAAAASRLGVTPDAVRQRIRRGTIEYDKTDDGRYYVYLTPQDGHRDGVQDPLANALVDRLKDENAFLRRELERKDALLLNMTEVMKAINPPSFATEPRESPVPYSQEQGDGSAPSEPERRSWWQRFFSA
jgi:hypothetical protein